MIYKKKPKDFSYLVGNKYGKLTVIKQTTFKSPYKVECFCECGRTKEVLIHYLLKGIVKSCGCLRGKYIESHPNIKKKKDPKNKCRKCGKDKGANKWVCDHCLNSMDEGILTFTVRY